MYASSDWMGFRCVGSSVTTYGKKARRQDHEPVDLSSTSDNEAQPEQPIDLSSTRENIGQDNQPIDLSSTSENEGQRDHPVRSSQARWNVQFEKLVEFKEKHGHSEWFSFLDSS
jgi:hypothetical protein